ncbi:MAG: hypothetical protein ACKOV8_00020, partial [Phycisphaerales bacterium]
MDRRVYGLAQAAVSARVPVRVPRWMASTSDRTASDTVREVLEGLGTHDVRTAAEALSAAFECGTWNPDVVVFDRSAGDATAFGAWVRRQHG